MDRPVTAGRGLVDADRTLHPLRERGSPAGRYPPLGSGRRALSAYRTPTQIPHPVASSRQLPATEPDADTMHDPDRKKGGARDHEWAMTVGCAKYDGCQPCRITGEH